MTGAEPYAHLIIANVHAPVIAEIGYTGVGLVGKKNSRCYVRGCIFFEIGELRQFIQRGAAEFIVGFGHYSRRCYRVFHQSGPALAEMAITSPEVLAQPLPAAEKIARNRQRAAFYIAKQDRSVALLLRTGNDGRAFEFGIDFALDDLYITGGNPTFYKFFHGEVL